MQRSALIFLSEARARKLVAAWSAMPPRKLEEEAELEMLAMAAGVEKSAARRLRPVLLANEIVGQNEDGIRWVDALVEQAVFAMAVERLPGMNERGDDGT